MKMHTEMVIIKEKKTPSEMKIERKNSMRHKNEKMRESDNWLAL